MPLNVALLNKLFQICHSPEDATEVDTATSPPLEPCERPLRFHRPSPRLDEIIWGLRKVANIARSISRSLPKKAQNNNIPNMFTSRLNTSSRGRGVSFITPRTTTSCLGKGRPLPNMTIKLIWQ